MSSIRYDLVFDTSTRLLHILRVLLPESRLEENPTSGDSYAEVTYEEYLELQELMGGVDSGLSEETIARHLKIRSHDVTSERMDEEPDICVICQDEFKKDELIGGLECRHEYHVECVKKWLQQRNCCPICKADAVSLST